MQACPIRMENRWHLNLRDSSRPTPRLLITNKCFGSCSIMSITPTIFSAFQWELARPTWWLHLSISTYILHKTNQTIQSLPITLWFWLHLGWSLQLFLLWRRYRSSTHLGSCQNLQQAIFGDSLSSRFSTNRRVQKRATGQKIPMRRKSLCTSIVGERVWWVWWLWPMQRK